VSNTERILFGVVLFIGGIAAGMYYEHQRFIREVQGLREEHAKTPAPVQPDPPPKTPEAAA
jgi:hypothetical protein